ncbi:MAG: LemA family protein [Bacteroidetes bacterium]|nr:LemA family protein [Bacteroidota bacterium]
MGFVIFLVIVAVLAILGVASYNGLVSTRNRYKNAFAQIDVQLKRRYDLIPNLVETAKAYMAHERGTLAEVIAARNAAASANTAASANPGDPQAMHALSQAEGALSGMLGRLFALSENYPDLKANTTMGQLMEELRSTENRVAFARQAFNDAVTTYNTKRESFPAVLFSSAMGFGPAELFEVESFEERETPKVSFE